MNRRTFIAGSIATLVAPAAPLHAAPSWPWLIDMNAVWRRFRVEKAAIVGVIPTISTPGGPVGVFGVGRHGLMSGALLFPDPLPDDPRLEDFDASARP